MTDLMKRNNYHGWYIGIMNEDTYAIQEKETQEFGPFSKHMAKKTTCFFNKLTKKKVGFKGIYAIAISGREAFTWQIKKAERKAGWSPNP